MSIPNFQVQSQVAVDTAVAEDEQLKTRLGIDKINPEYVTRADESLISSERALREANVRAGDFIIEYPNGEWEIKRAVSQEPFGSVVTEELLQEHPELIEQGISVNDQIKTNEDGSWEVKYSGYNNKMENLKYHFEVTETAFDNLFDYAYSEYPEQMEFVSQVTKALPTVPNIDSRMYGEDFLEISPDERRKRIVDVEKQAVLDRYPDLVPEQGTLSGFTGTMGKAIVADPLTYVPLGGAGMKTISAMSAGVSGLDEAARQLADTGGITDTKQLASAVLIGGVAPTAIKKTAQGVVALPSAIATSGKKVFDTSLEVAEKLNSKKLAAKNKRTNDAQVIKFDEKLEAKLAEGKDMTKAVDEITEEMNIDNVKAAELAYSSEVRKADGVWEDFKDIHHKTFQEEVRAGGLFPDSTKQTIKDFTQFVSEGIKRKAPRVYGRLMQAERATGVRLEKAFNEVAESVTALRSLKDDQYRLLSKYLYENKPEAAKAVLINNNLDANLLEPFYKVYREIGDELGIKMMDDFWHRRVKDVKGLQKVLTQREKAEGKEPTKRGTASKVAKAMETYAKVTGRKVNKLSAREKEYITDSVMQGYTFKIREKTAKEVEETKTLSFAGKSPLTVDRVPDTSRGGVLTSSFTKTRRVEDLDAELLGFYDDPINAFMSYVRSASSTIETNKLFGISKTKERKALLKTVEDMEKLIFQRETGQLDPEMSKSIGDYVTQAYRRGEIGEEDIDDIVGLLQTRFGAGEQAMSDWSAKMRDQANLLYLANLKSAAVNLTDLVYTFRDHGVSNGIDGILKAIGRRKSPAVIKAIDLGISKAAQELQDPSALSSWVAKAFRATGFNASDILGKEAYVNALFSSMAKKAETPEGIQSILAEAAKVVDPRNIPKIRQALQTGVKNRELIDYTYMKLAERFPITRTHRPVVAMENPRFQFIYTLKSYQLQALQNFRNMVVDEFKKGNYTEASKNAMLLTVGLSALTGATKLPFDLLNGKEIKTEDLPNRLLGNTLGIFFVDRYSSSKFLQQGDVEGWAAHVISPIMPVYAFMGNALDELVIDPVTTEQGAEFSKVVKEVPIIGEFTYNYFLAEGEPLKPKRPERPKRPDRPKRPERP